MLSGGLLRKPSARVGTAAYWIEVFNEQAERERSRRGGLAAPLDGPPDPLDGNTPQSS